MRLSAKLGQRAERKHRKSGEKVRLYSLDEEQPDEATRQLVGQWRGVILEIAREEMGHLATVQNLLIGIGGPLFV
jgi:hypothetical protein